MLYSLDCILTKACSMLAEVSIVNLVALVLAPTWRWFFAVVVEIVPFGTRNMNKNNHPNRILLLYDGVQIIRSNSVACRLWVHSVPSILSLAFFNLRYLVTNAFLVVTNTLLLFNFFVTINMLYISIKRFAVTVAIKLHIPYPLLDR